MNQTSSCCKTPAMGAVLERPRFYPRQLVTPEILTLGHDYLRHKQRLHNRLLHGWGVVCGLMVCPAPAGDKASYEPWKVVVKPGYAFGPHGDGILVDCDSVVDLRTPAGKADAGCGEPAADPWCADVFVERTEGIYYIAIKYAETMIRPERAQPTGCGCGCGSTLCESSRWKDSFEVGVLAECPHDEDETPPADILALMKGEMPACPECGTGPWVGLARVEVDADGNVIVIDNCACRRLVASFANFWWQCVHEGMTLEANPPAIEVEAGGEEVDIAFKADNVPANAKITVTRDVTVTSWSQTGDTINAKVKASANARPGPRTIVVVDPGCGMATLGGVIEVTAGSRIMARRRIAKRVVPHR